MINSVKTIRSRWPLFVQLMALVALGLFVSAPVAHAQCPNPPSSGCTIDIPAGTSYNPYIGGDNGTGGVDGVCFNYTTYACIIVAAFNANSYGYYYVTSGGSSNGLSGQTIFEAVNNVYQTSYTTTGNSYNPGTIAVIAPLNATYTFLGAQYFGSNCTNQDYYYFGPYVTTAFGSTQYIYGVGIPYKGTGC